MSEPTDEDYCAAGGHAFYVVDAGVGRCYCGQVTWAQPPEVEPAPDPSVQP